MEIIGYFASLLIGISLGLIGGGGSILTVPVLVYLFRVEPVLATAYSLFIVPAIPKEIFSVGDFIITKSILLMVLFAVLMVFASISMIKGKKDIQEDVSEKQKFNYPMILVEGTVVGILTGLVGAGGGFLIIPALVIFSKLPMKQAVGTSLLIIAAKSLIGFTGDLSNYTMDWKLLLTVTGLAIVGIFIGDFLSKKIHGNKLKKGFGWFVLIMGIYIIIKELFFPGSGGH